MSKYNPNDQRIQKQSFSNYCECAADMVMDRFTLNEVMKLEEKALGKSPNLHCSFNILDYEVRFGDEEDCIGIEYE